MSDMKPTPTLVRSITEAMRHIKRGEPVRAVGVGGSLTVDRDAYGIWCGAYYRAGERLSFRQLAYTIDVHDWLRAFFPRILGRDPRGDTSRYRGGRMGREDRRRLYTPPTRTRCRRK